MARDDKEIETLRKKFICVRFDDMRGVDIDLFQFDYDMTMSVFFLSSDAKTIYARFGARESGLPPETFYSLRSLKRLMTRVLELHKGSSSNRALFDGKVGKKKRWNRPEKIPSLSKVKKWSCIHCHNVAEGEIEEDMKTGSKNRKWPYPLPSSIGLRVDPHLGTQVARVQEDSAASRAGIRSGDLILRLNNQIVLSVADIQWVLHNLSDKSILKVSYSRDKKVGHTTLALSGDWKKSNLRWRRHSNSVWRRYLTK